MKRLAILLALSAGCQKQEQAKPGPVAQMSPAETQRSQDACKVYVERVCACADQVAPVKKQCELSRALPDAIRINIEVAANPDSKPDVVARAYEGVRETAKECIEQTAKLPALGCPAQ